MLSTSNKRNDKKNNANIIANSIVVFSKYDHDSFEWHTPKLEKLNNNDFIHDSSNLNAYKISTYDIKSLLKNDIKYWSINDPIYYTFNINDTVKVKLKNINRHNSSHTINELSNFNKEIIRNCFDIWEKYSPLRFIEQNDRYHHQIYSYVGHDNSTVMAYATIGRVGLSNGLMGFDERHLEAKTLFVNALHEIGHIQGLEDGHLEPYSTLKNPDNCGFKATKDFSIMNYGSSTFHISPMTTDSICVKRLTGKYYLLKPEHNTYYIDDYTRHQYPELFKRSMWQNYNFRTKKMEFSLSKDKNSLFSNYVTGDKTTASFPLISETNTISSEHNNQTTTIDLRQFHASENEDGKIYTPIDIDHAITGPGRSTIYLNMKNNYVNMTLSYQSTQPNILYIDPQNCGQDLVAGFNFKRDKIFLYHPSGAYNPLLNSYILKYEVLNCFYNNKMINNKCNAITLEFMNNQKISFLSTNQFEDNFNHLNITMKYTHIEENYLIKEAASDFVNCFMINFTSSLFQSLLNDVLDIYDLNPTQKKIINMTLYSLYLLYSGNIISNLAGTVVSEVLTRGLKFDSDASKFYGKTIATGCHIIHDIAKGDTDILVRSATRLTGDLSGNIFSFWFKNKVCTNKVMQQLRNLQFSCNSMCNIL